MKKILERVTWGVMIVAVLAAACVMVFHLGLIEGLDFGCGQYYYTDIPGWERYFSGEHFIDSLPHWIYYVLFFAWGGLIWQFWAWLDRRGTGKESA